MLCRYVRHIFQFNGCYLRRRKKSYCFHLVGEAIFDKAPIWMPQKEKVRINSAAASRG